MPVVNVLWVIDHVCFDGDLHGGGRLFMNLAPRFDPRRVKVHPYFLRASPEVNRVFREASHPVIDLARSKYDPTTLLKLDQLCRVHDIDVMHLFCYASSTLGRVVGKMRGVPAIIHDFDTQIYFPYPAYLRVMDRLLAGGTGHALAASSACRDYMRDVRRVPGDRIDIMYHAIPDGMLERAAGRDRKAVRRDLGWPQDAFMFAAVTKLGPDRGNETLLQAFRTVVDGAPDARLALVYKPTVYHRIPKEYESLDWVRDVSRMRQMIDELVQRLGLEEHVYLVEMAGSLEPYYAASDVLVAPFENSRFSSVQLVEGLAHGRPFIATALGEPQEIMDEFQVGTLVPPADPGALAKAMLELLRSPARMAELSSRATQAAREFTVDAAAARLSAVYERMAGAGAGTTGSQGVSA